MNLTKREYFAAAALQGLIANHGANTRAAADAAWAAESADALIEALNGKPPKNASFKDAIEALRLLLYGSKRVQQLGVSQPQLNGGVILANKGKPL